jgi:hypothetical protein
VISIRLVEMENGLVFFRNWQLLSNSRIVFIDLGALEQKAVPCTPCLPMQNGLATWRAPLPPHSNCIGRNTYTLVDF